MATALEEPSGFGETTAAHCRHCLYSLEGITKHRCPECGAEFDPLDPRTFSSSARRALRLEGVGSCVWSLLVGVMLAQFSRTGLPWRSPPIIVEALRWMPPIVFVALGIGFGVAALRRPTALNLVCGTIGLALSLYWAALLVFCWKDL
jgi:hypothetical protein